MTVAETVYRRLHDDIVGWRRLPGEPLAETELSASLGVSRTPLREALARLALEGLVDTSRKTAVVASFSSDGIRELFELREALEVQAARIAARRRDPAEFDALVTAFRAAQDSLRFGGVDEYYELVAGFDAAMTAAIRNEPLRAAIDALRPHLARARRNAADDAARLVRSASEHELICAAIRDGDPSLAAAATVVHLDQSLRHLLSAIADTGIERTEAG